MLRTGLIVNSGTIGQRRASLSQRLFDVGEIKTSVARSVQMNPKQFFTLACRLSIGGAKGDLGKLQTVARLTGAAIVIAFKQQQLMSANTLDQQVALGVLFRRKIVVAPNCESFVIHRLFSQLLSSLPNDDFLSGIIESDTLARVQSSNSHAERD